ncbi:MAG: histidine phosphatase family protein [Melioribacteraceae bacterium]
MKQLILIRHAKSSWSDYNITDIERPLNNRGKRDAPFMGELLFKKQIIPDIIYSSPAVRAFTTAKIIAQEVNYPTDKIIKKSEIYEASPGSLLQLVNSFSDEDKTVIMFGHNPGFTLLTNYLHNNFITNMPTCSVVHLSFDTNSWQEITADSGTLVRFEYPKKYNNQ